MTFARIFSFVVSAALLAGPVIAVALESRGQKSGDEAKGADLPDYCKAKMESNVFVNVLIDLGACVKNLTWGAATCPNKGFGLFDVTIPDPKGGTHTFKCALAGMPTSNETVPIVEVVNTAKLLRVWNGDRLQWDCEDEPYVSSDKPKKPARGID